MVEEEVGYPVCVCVCVCVCVLYVNTAIVS